jgi:hypothetical protein
MANWAYTSYAIEGPKETLQKIEQAINIALDKEEYKGSEPLNKDATEGWEGNMLIALGIEWEDRKPDGTGVYLRGFIDYEAWWDDGSLRFNAEEAWGATDLNEVLEKNIPGIKVYYSVEEEGCEVFATNDKEGKYFPERYWVDTAQDDIYNSEYFITEEAMYKWLDEKYGVKSEEEVAAWNANYEATGDECENFIYIHKFEIED